MAELAPQLQEWIDNLDGMLEVMGYTYRTWYVEMDAPFADLDLEDAMDDFCYEHGKVVGYAEARGLTVEQVLDGADPVLPMGTDHTLPGPDGKGRLGRMYYVWTPKGISLDVVCDHGVEPTAIAFPMNESGHILAGAKTDRVTQQPSRMHIRRGDDGETSMMCIALDPA